MCVCVCLSMCLSVCVCLVGFLGVGCGPVLGELGAVGGRGGLSVALVEWGCTWLGSDCQLGGEGHLTNRTSVAHAEKQCETV